MWTPRSEIPLDTIWLSRSRSDPASYLFLRDLYRLTFQGSAQIMKIFIQFIFLFSAIPWGFPVQGHSRGFPTMGTLIAYLFIFSWSSICYMFLAQYFSNSIINYVCTIGQGNTYFLPVPTSSVIRVYSWLNQNSLRHAFDGLVEAVGKRSAVSAILQGGLCGGHRLQHLVRAGHGRRWAWTWMWTRTHW